MSSAFDLGRVAFAEGKTLEDNPFDSSGPDPDEARDAWQAGWQDAAQQAGDGGGAADSDAGATPDVGGTADATASLTGELTIAEVADPGALGDEGYRRLMELLEGAPVPGETVPPLPSGEVPSDLKEWVEAMKEPLVYMTVDTLRSAVTHRLSGTDRGRLRELYGAMTPMQIAAVMARNAEVIRHFADQRAGEAALITDMQSRLTMAGTRVLLTALAAI